MIASVIEQNQPPHAVILRNAVTKDLAATKTKIIRCAQDDTAGGWLNYRFILLCLFLLRTIPWKVPECRPHRWRKGNPLTLRFTPYKRGLRAAWRRLAKKAVEALFSLLLILRTVGANCVRPIQCSAGETSSRSSLLPPFNSPYCRGELCSPAPLFRVSALLKRSRLRPPKKRCRPQAAEDCRKELSSEARLSIG